MPALKTRMLKVSCACDAAYVCRVARSHLARWGAPLCPACKAPMQAPEGIDVHTQDLGDVFADLTLVACGEARALREIENRFVKIRAERRCMDCGRAHERGWSMQLCVGRNGREIVRGHFCAEGCQAPAATEHPGGVPRGFRLTEEHTSKSVGWSEAGGYSQGWGEGARS